MKKRIPALAIILSGIISTTIGACQDNEAVINSIDLQLKSGETTVTNVLTSEALMYLHPITEFREVIKANAKAEKISIVTDNEPGKRITVKGLVVDNNDQPQKGATIYVYQTSDKGWYSDTGAHILVREGDFGHARLFGYLKTDAKGEFSYNTIMPVGYPQTDMPAHIHIQLWSEEMKPLHAPGEFQFEEDPRMTPERRERSLADGFLISKNTGTDEEPVYEYKIITK